MSLLGKPANSITLSDLNALIENAVLESAAPRFQQIDSSYLTQSFAAILLLWLDPKPQPANKLNS